MSDTPPDWVLLEAAKRFDWGDDIGELREYYTAPCCASEKGYRALCDMIAKYEKPPIDPDVEAVKRIMRAAYILKDHLPPSLLDCAVAQYKLERAK